MLMYNIHRNYIQRYEYILLPIKLSIRYQNYFQCSISIYPSMKTLHDSVDSLFAYHNHDIFVFRFFYFN